MYEIVDPEAIQKFRLSGAPEREIRVPNPEHALLPEEGHLTEDPRTGLIIGLKQDGILFTMDTNLTVRQIWDLKAINWDERAIYDVQTGQVRAGFIVPAQTEFGRVYAVQAGSATELWITANWVTIPFVMRMAVDATGRITVPKVVVQSNIPTAPNVQPGGIAVSDSGVVLTTLPIKRGLGVFVEKIAVAFSRGFEPGNPNEAPQILFSKPDGTHQDIGSVSIAADAAGNFYVSTGTTGSLLCGGSGTGAIIVIAKTLATAKCFSIFNASVVPEVEDIVVNRAGNFGFLAVTGASEIISFFIGP
jgi:hypothetical protein